MPDIQSVFNKIQTIKKEVKEIRKSYKDALAQDPEYVEVSEKIKELRERKKQAETIVQNQMGKQWEKLQDFKIDLESEQEMLNDLAMNTLMAGKTVSVKDEYENDYEPIFVVNFKKAN